MKRPGILCTCCRGTGVMPLMAGHWKVLKKLQKAGTLMTTAELVGKGETVMLISNRLVDLERYRFVRRQAKRGRYWLWEAVGKV